MELVQPIRDKKQIESMKRYLKSDKQNGLRNLLLFSLGINSGLRISDLLNLKISDVINEKGKVRDRITITEHKTGKRKSFPISNNLKKTIQDYIDVRKNFEYEDYLFLSKKKNRLSRNMAWEILNDAAKNIGIKENIGTHTLRKTFGYWAYKQQMDITLIMQMLNHSSPSVTLRYIGITQESLDRAYLSLDL